VCHDAAITQVEAIVRLARDVLAEDLIGANLHGSAVLGQLRPRSDTDVLVVSRRGLSQGERRERCPHPGPDLIDGRHGFAPGQGRRRRLGPRAPARGAPPGPRARPAIYLGEVEDEAMTDLWPRARPHADHVVREIERAVAAKAAANP
jgi:hypothetical protein